MHLIRIIVVLVIGISTNSNAMEIDQITHKTTPASLVDLCAERIARSTLNLENDDYNKIISKKISTSSLRSTISTKRECMLKGLEIISQQVLFNQKYRTKIPFCDIKDVLSQSNTRAKTQDQKVKIILTQPNEEESFIIIESNKNMKVIKGNYIQSIGLTENPLLIWAIERKGHRKETTKIRDETSRRYLMIPIYCNESHKPEYDITCYNDDGLFLGKLKSMVPIFNINIIKDGTSIAWFIKNDYSVEQRECDLTKFKQFINQIQKITPRELYNIGSAPTKTYMDELLNKLDKTVNTTIQGKLRPVKKQKTN